MPPGRLPCVHAADQRRRVAGDVLRRLVFVRKEVREVAPRRLRQVVEEFVERERPHSREAETIGLVEVRTEPVESDRRHAHRPRQVAQLRGELRHPVVIVWRFARESEEHVPQRLDAEFLAPLQQLNVLQARDAFLHLLQHVVAEALDAGLDDRDAGVAQQPDLIFLEVRFRLVEQRDLQLPLGQHRQQRSEVLEIENVVDDLDVAAGVSGRQVRQLVECPRGRFAAIRHRLAVEAAERAVHPLAPPAAARRFDVHARLPLIAEPAARKLIEVVGVIGVRQHVNVVDDRRRRAAAQAPRCERLSGDHAGQSLDRIARNDARREVAHHAIGFAGDHGIDEGKLAHRFHPHRGFAVRAADHDERAGEARLDAFGEREGRQMLLEHAREAEQARFEIDDPAGAPVDE